MICPSCHGEMYPIKNDTYKGSTKWYDREIFQCAEEDIWVTIETPQATE